MGAAEILGEEIGLALSPFDRSHPDYEGLLAAARPGEAGGGFRGRIPRPPRGQSPAPRPAPPPRRRPAPTSEPPAYSASLSAREVEVLRLLASGMTNSRIAKELYISPRTVNAHLGSVYHKIGSSTRAEAARFASEHGLL